MSGQPNIVFIMTDDQRYDTFGFNSNGVVITPNLDKMEERGVWFNNACHVSPICMPSRASVHMSCYISDHQCGFDLPTNKTVTTEEFRKSYPVLLKEAGYFTGFVGKFGYSVADEKKPNAERVYGTRIYPDAYKRINFLEARESCVPKKEFDIWYGNTGQEPYFPDENNCFSGIANTFGSKHLTHFNGKLAEDFIDKAVESGKPFNLSVSFKAPHNPLTPEQRHLDLYKDKVIPRRVNDTPRHHALLPEVVRKKSRNPEYYFNTGEWADWESGTWEKEENYQNDLKKYCALVTGVDEAVGDIIKKLEEHGIADNTILIYTADNGMFCGSRQIHGKSILYEESIKAPMLVCDPRLPKDRHQTQVDHLISHVDIAPTILDYAGVSADASYRGVSFKPLVDGVDEAIHEYVFGENDFNNNFLPKEEVKDPSTYQSIRSKYVRGRRYKFIKYHECEPVIEELFDVIGDPYEEKNLVGDEKFKAIHELMLEKLDEFVAQSK